MLPDAVLTSRGPRPGWAVTASGKARPLTSRSCTCGPGVVLTPRVASWDTIASTFRVTVCLGFTSLQGCGLVSQPLACHCDFGRERWRAAAEQDAAEPRQSPSGVCTREPGFVTAASRCGTITAFTFLAATVLGDPLSLVPTSSSENTDLPNLS